MITNLDWNGKVHLDEMFQCLIGVALVGSQNRETQREPYRLRTGFWYYYYSPRPLLSLKRYYLAAQCHPSLSPPHQRCISRWNIAEERWPTACIQQLPTTHGWWLMTPSHARSFPRCTPAGIRSDILQAMVKLATLLLSEGSSEYHWASFLRWPDGTVNDNSCI